MSEFVDYLHEVLAPFGAVNAKRMFGGHGIYHDGLMFGLVADDELYLKVDEETKADFEAVGSGPFVYMKQGKPMNISYYRAPEVIFDDPDEALTWARLAFDAALRGRKPPRPKSTSKLTRKVARKPTGKLTKRATRKADS
jgi:DNA transformation protein